MKSLSITALTYILALSTLPGLAGCQETLTATDSGDKTMLFNGRDLAGWKMFVPDRGVDVNTIWSVKDGVIRCKGKPNGYIRTKKNYSNYKLHVEWRWAAKPTNSGVLLHASGPDAVWPRCIEAQLKAQNAGDFVLIKGTGVTVGGRNLQDVAKTYVVGAKKHNSNEKAAGQWNSYDIHCKGDSIKVYVNGLLQNEGTSASDSSGWICLQSEGSEIEFRNIYLRDI